MDAFDAIILCAGLGTRLRPLTDRTAKPAVPLLGRPLVGYPLALLKAAGFARVCLNTHWQPEAMRRAAESEAAPLGLTLDVSHEPRILGTGGALGQARERGLVRRDRPLVVLNGDVLFDVDLERVLRAHLESGAAATMVLRRMPAGASYSPVEADAQGRIHRIGRYGTPGPGPGHLFTGVHVLSAAALDRLPPGESGVVETVYAPLLAEGARVQAVFEQGLWLDLGDPRGYLEAHLALLAGTSPLGALERLGILTRPVRGVSPDAVVAADAIVARSSIGSGAVVGAGAHVEDSVVWPGSRVEAGEELRRTIVTPDVRVVAP